MRRAFLFSEGVDMPMHDWSGADRLLYHNLQLGWTGRLSATLNGGLLPSSHYALLERARDGRKSAFVEIPEREDPIPKIPEHPGGLLFVGDSPPQATVHDVCTHPEY